MNFAQSMIGALVAGALLGGLTRAVLGRRSHMSFPALILAGILGAGLGAGLANLLLGPPNTFDHIALFIVTALIVAIVVTFGVVLAATALSRPPRRTAGEVIAAGESATVEFKSTARFNLHTNARDPKLELVIAKTVAGFANTDGGELLIGVADDGTILGLEQDLGLMKQPDIDRYELWLRDWLSATLGPALAATVQVTFPTVDQIAICRIEVPAAHRPIFLTSKGKDAELWVRIGNSTRQLPVDEALSYATRHWGRRELRRRP